MSNYKILCVGNDAALLGAHSAALASAGFCPLATTPYWATMLLHKERFDAVVLSHTLTKAELSLLRFQAESSGRGKIPLVQIYALAQEPELDFACSSGEYERLPWIVAAAIEDNRTAATA